jgi:hypothetical protein
MPDAVQPPVSIGLVYGTAEDGSRTVTIPDDLREFVVSFVRKGGAKTSAEIEAIVQTGHGDLLAALAPLSEAQAAYKPSADVWSVLELMAHVVSTQQIVVALTANLGAGHLPPGFGPQFEEQNAQDGVTISRFDTLAEARAASETAHDQLLAFVRGIDTSTNADVRFRHFLFGAFNAREWAIFQRIHDIDHTPQIGQIKASPGFPAA